MIGFVCKHRNSTARISHDMFPIGSLSLVGAKTPAQHNNTSHLLI